MSNTRSRLVDGVRQLAGNLPDTPEGLPSSLIFEELINCENAMLRDLNLSTQHRRVMMQEVVLGTDEESFLVPWTDFSAPAYVYLQTTGSDYWYPVELVSQAALPEATANNQLALALSGTPQSGYISWLPDSTHTLRIWYEREVNDNPTLADTTELGGLYDDYLKLQVAAQCREYLKLEVGDVLKSRLNRSEKQWQRYVNRAGQRGSGYKTPVFTPPRLRRAFPFVDRTRFFVP